MIKKRVCTNPDNASKRNNLPLLQHFIFGFCDQGKFSFELIHRGLPSALYPVCGAQVFLEIDFYATIDLLILATLKRLTSKVIDTQAI